MNISSSPQSKQIVLFIDSQVPDQDFLAQSAKPDTQIYFIDSDQDGIRQITDILKQHHNLDSVHIVSHGQPAKLFLGNSVLSAETLPAYQSFLQDWVKAFSDTTDILIYGCNVAKGSEGAAFVSALAQVTQANVAASSDIIGATTRGRNWNLDISSGQINSEIFVSATGIAQYQHTFATFDFETATGDLTPTVTQTISGVTLTVTIDADTLNIENGLGIGGTSGNVITDTGGNHTTETFSFSTAIDLTSFRLADVGLIGPDLVFTPVGGSGNSVVNATSTSIGATITTNWTGITSFTVTKNGGGNISSGVIFDTLVFTVSNATPTISIANTNLSYIENTAAIQIDSAATVSDSDGDADWNGGKLEVQITVNNEAADRISISDTDGDGTFITISGTDIFANATDIGDLSASGGTVTNGTKLTITFDADATNANVQEVLQSIRYDSTSENPGTTSRTVTFTATDKNAASASDTRTIAVTAVNDEPTLTATGANPTFTEGGAAATLYSSAAVSTIESGQTVTGLALTVTNINDGSSELLNADGTSIALTHGTSGTTATNSLNYSVAVIGSTANVTLSGGTLSTANAQTLINGLSYQNNSQNPNTSNRVVTIFSLTDSGGTANSGDDTVNVAIASTVTVASVNDDPSITSLPTDITVTEDTASNVDLSAATFSDVDAGSNSITLTLAAGAGTLTSASGGSVTVGGSGTATLTLSGTATNIDTFLNTASNIQYTTASNAVGNNVTTLSLTANDGGNTGTGGGTNVALGTVNIDSTEVGDTPSVTNSTTNEDTQTTSGLVLSRNISDSTAVTHFKITNITGGTLFKNDGTTAIVNNDFITFAEGNAGLKFLPSANSTTDGSFNIQAGTDGVGGGLSTGSATATITVNAVNDRPSLANLNGDTVTYFVAGAAVSLDNGANVTLTDIDSTDFNGGNVTVSVTANAQIAEDKLQIGSVGAISTSGSDVIHSDSGGTTIGTFTGGTGGVNLVITLNANATAARTQDLLKALQYVNTNAATTNTAAKTVRITVDDGDGGDSPSTNQDVTVNLQALPTITSATYDVSTGQLVLTGTDFVAQAGATNDVIANKLTITGEGNASYTLTDTANVEISSATSATVTLSATDKLNVHGLLNKNLTSSGDGTTYNIAAADGWMPQSPGDESDSVNGITVSNVAIPNIVSAVYDAPNHNLFVTGTNFFKKPGANNDIDASKLTMIGGNSASYTLITTSDVEITSATSFTIHLSNGDDSVMYGIYNQLGTQSSYGTIYDIQAADGWLTAADSAVNIADNTAEGGVTVTISPMITSSTYNATTGVLVVTGSNIEADAGIDIDVSQLTFTGEGGVTYTLTDSADVERDSSSQFTVTLSATDKAAVNLLLNKIGTSSVGGTTYNLSAADDWCACPSTAAANTSDTTNAITVNNVPVPAITSATYNASSGALIVTGSGFLNTGGAANDIIANKFTITGEGGETYTLTDTANIDITSGTDFTLTLSATDQAAVNLIVNKDGTASTGGTTYNLAAAEDWAAGADAAVNVVDATGNGITVSNVAVPTITSATYNSGTGVLAVTGTGLLKLIGSNNDIDASLFTFTGLASGTYTLTDTADVDITSATEFTLTLSATDKTAVNALLNANGTEASDMTTYNLAALEDWAAGADAAVNVIDAAGNGITVTIPPPSGGGGGTTTPPPPTTTTVDGTTVTTQTETDGSTTLTVPFIEETRIEDPNTLLVTHADIPILTNDTGDPILTVSLPVGVGLSVNGQTEPMSTQDAINDLVERIEQKITTDSNTLLDMTVQGQNFITSLSTDDVVSVQTLSLSVSDDFTPGQTIFINGSDFPGDGKIALIIDASNLPPGTEIKLDNIAFAAITGAVRVIGGKGDNFVVFNEQNQSSVLGEGDDILFGGGGDDTIGSLGGNDQTAGDAGNDIVFGGAGHDILTGGTGNDALNGGFGFDTAVQPGTLADYQITVNNNQVIFTHTNGATDTLTDVELVQFETGQSLAIAHSETEAVAHHLVKTWLERDLTVAEGHAIQSWNGTDINVIVNAFQNLPDAADFKNLSADELIAGLNENPNVIRLNSVRDLVGGDSNDQGYLSLELALNVDGGGGHDVLRMHGTRDDVHLEQIDNTIEITRLNEGAMLNLRNAEMIAFDSGEKVVLAHNEVEGILGRLFQTFFDRDATISEWQQEREALISGVEPDVILDWFQTHASLSALDDTDYIQTLYMQTLGRSATESELTQQLIRLGNGEISREWLAVDIAGSDEAATAVGSVMLLDGGI